jgi:beta-galactosidase
MGDARVAPVLALDPWPAGLDAVRRHGPDGSYLFAINHGSEPVPVPVEGTDLVTGQDWTMDMALAAGDLAVIRETAPNRPRSEGRPHAGTTATGSDPSGG